MFGLTRSELRTLRRLSTPSKVQDFLNALPYNFEPNGDTCQSPRTVLRRRTAHCIEGAMLAGLAFRLHGRPALVLDLEATANDDAHVIALFRKRGLWGAVSKTNHAVLRFRDPVYRSIRELVMSYFHEYTDNNGRKTLRSFSRPVNLSRFDTRGWMTAAEDVFYVAEYIANAPHTRLLRAGQSPRLRGIDAIEHETGSIMEYKKPAQKRQRGLR